MAANPYPDWVRQKSRWKDYYPGPVRHLSEAEWHAKKKKEWYLERRNAKPTAAPGDKTGHQLPADLR